MKLLLIYANTGLFVSNLPDQNILTTKERICRISAELSFMDKNYNYERQKLMLPEYGRHIHQMVDYLLGIEDRELRNRQARAVIDVMGNLNPTLRDTADFAHKLWDHLFIMSGFRLDVDSPYPMPDPETLFCKPARLPYPVHNVARKHYGKHIENMIRSLRESDDQQSRDAVVSNIAKFMRAKSYEYNQEHPMNEIIINDIKRMSDNAITVDETALTALKSDYKQGAMLPAGNAQRQNKKKHANKKATKLMKGGKIRRGNK